MKIVFKMPIASPNVSPAPISLAKLKPGMVAQVVGIESPSGTNPALAIRLMEMGLVEGTRVALVKKAPFGSPFEFSVRGYHLSLRKDEADIIQVQLLD